MKFIQLMMIQWSKDPSKYIVAQRGSDLFEDARACTAEWTLVLSETVLSPLYRPIPNDHALFLAERKQAFPYNTTAILEIKDVFNPSGRGFYFIAPFDLVEKLRDLIRVES